MPSIPTKPKMFFCRITRPFSQIIFETLHDELTHITNKFYSHPIDVLAYCHEVGKETEKPHYHLLIICKTTKHEVTKLIKQFFNCSGNEDFSVVDKYCPSTFNISLSYMFKGGTNGEKFRVFIKSADFPYAMPSEQTMIEIYNNNSQFTKISDAQKKFKYYFDLVKKELPQWTLQETNNPLQIVTKEKLFFFIYRILLQDAIKTKTLFRFNIISEHARCILIHINPVLVHWYSEQSTIKEFKVI